MRSLSHHHEVIGSETVSGDDSNLGNGSSCHRGHELGMCHQSAAQSIAWKHKTLSRHSCHDIHNSDEKIVIS